MKNIVVNLQKIEEVETREQQEALRLLAKEKARLEADIKSMAFPHVRRKNARILPEQEIAKARYYQYSAAQIKLLQEQQTTLLQQEEEVRSCQKIGQVRAKMIQTYQAQQRKKKEQKSARQYSLFLQNWHIFSFAGS
jgi:hypothetical protein